MHGQTENATDQRPLNSLVDELMKLSGDLGEQTAALADHMNPRPPAPVSNQAMPGQDPRHTREPTPNERLLIVIMRLHQTHADVQRLRASITG